MKEASPAGTLAPRVPRSVGLAMSCAPDTAAASAISCTCVDADNRSESHGTIILANQTRDKRAGS
jgi:hypothetical protein